MWGIVWLVCGLKSLSSLSICLTVVCCGFVFLSMWWSHYTFKLFHHSAVDILLIILISYFPAAFYFLLTKCAFCYPLSYLELTGNNKKICSYFWSAETFFTLNSAWHLQHFTFIAHTICIYYALSLCASAFRSEAAGL